MKFNFKEKIKSLLWSPDDNFIMCIGATNGTIYLRTITNEVIEQELEGWTGII